MYGVYMNVREAKELAEMQDIANRNNNLLLCNYVSYTNY